MRIIAGNLKGKFINNPKGARTHPMSEKIRGALFNALGDIEDLSVLDAYSGTGAISIEAISRGATHSTAIEIDKKAASVIKNSVEQLGLQGKVKVIRANVTGWSENNPDKLFDLVIADPPFDQLKVAALSKMAKHTSKSGVFCLNWPGKTSLPELDGMELISEKDYGDARLGFYKTA